DVLEDRALAAGPAAVAGGPAAAKPGLAEGGEEKVLLEGDRRHRRVRDALELRPRVVVLEPDPAAAFGEIAAGVIVHEERGHEAASVRCEETAAFGGIGGHLGGPEMGQDRRHDDEVEAAVLERESDRGGGAGPVRVVELVSDVEMTEAEIGIGARDRAPAPGDALGDDIDAFVGA